MNEKITTIAVKVDVETKRRAVALADKNPYASGNLSVYIRGLVNTAWENEVNSNDLVRELRDSLNNGAQSSGNSKRLVVAKGLDGMTVVDPEFENK